MVADATGRITRPRQIYTGELRRKFVPVYERQLSGCIAVPSDVKDQSAFRSNLLSRLVDTSARSALR
jgi:starvation-inducible outer membrane lipoprotein